MFKAFGKEIENSDIIDIIDIIREKVVKLYDTQQTIIQVPNSDIAKEIRKTCHQPFHLEYYLDVNGNIRRENFYKNVKLGDILYGRVLNYRSSGHYFVNIFAALGNGKRRNLIDCDVVAHMKSDDTDPKVEDSDSYGNWEIKTQLLVEVLYVQNHGGSPRLHVGTKGTTLTKYQGEKVFLGKVTEPFPITDTSWDERSPSYSKALLKSKTFNRAKSTKILCQLFNLNDKMDSSYANRIRVRNFASSRPDPDTDNDSDIEVIESSSDSEEIQVTKVELSEKQKTDNLIRHAICNYRNGSYKQVLGKLESVFEIDPTNIMAIVALAVTKYRLKDSIGACKLLTMALDLDPENIDAIVAKASILCNDGNLDEALELLESAIKEDPNRTKAQYNKAKSYYCKMAEEKALDYLRNGNEQEAIVWLNKVVQINPENNDVKNYLSRLKKKAYTDSAELICLSSDEDDEVVKETSPIEMIRSPSIEQADLSDDDQEESQVEDSYHSRVSQYLQKIDGCESNDLSVNQKKIYTDATEIGDESSTSERESDICEQVFENNEFENTEKNESVARYDDKFERTDYEKLNVSKIENPSTMLSENLKERENSQITIDSLEKESTNNNKTDSKENENMMKKIPKKRTLPKLKRLPIGYMVENNSLHTKPQNNQRITKQEESSKKKQSQSEMSNEKEMSNSPIESNLRNDNIIENKAQHSRNYKDNYDFTNTEGTSLEREKSYEKNKISNETEENRSEDNEETQYFKITNTQEIHKTQDLSRKDNNFDKNRENSKKKKYEDSINNKSSSTEKHKISHNNKEAIEKSKSKKPIDNSSKSSRDSLKKYSDSNRCTKQMLGNDSEIAANNVKQLHSKQEDISKTNIKNNHKITNDSLKTNPNDDDDIFGVKGNSLNTMNLDDFDLPDIETSMYMYNSPSEHYDQQNTEDENINAGEYDELNELRKDLERTTSIEDTKGKKEKAEDKNRKIFLNNGKTKTNREFLQKLREENEKTEKRKSEISNRSTKEIKRNTAKESQKKLNDGRRIILLAEAIVPPSEIRKRRRRKNDVLHEDEEETSKKKNAGKGRKNEDEEESPKNKSAGKGRKNEDEEETPKKKSRKSKNSEILSESIAGPSTPQTPISSIPIQCSSVEVQTPTLHSSSSQKESSGPRELTKKKIVEALCKRHASVRREFEDIDENDIKYIATDIEEEIFKLYDGDTGRNYRSKYRSLSFNISNPKNETLFRKILNSEVSAGVLVRMESNELASEDLARWLKMRKNKELDTIKQAARADIQSSKSQVILKNHKGELEITNDYGQEAIESLNEFPEDYLSIDLNIKSSIGNKSKKEKRKQKTSKR